MRSAVWDPLRTERVFVQAILQAPAATPAWLGVPNRVAPAVGRLRRRRQDLDAEIGRVPDRRIQVHQMSPRRREEEDVRLDDVVLGEHDVNRRFNGEATHRSGVDREPLGQPHLDHLMPGQGRRDHVHLAVIELVPAPVLRRPLQVGIADARLHRPHGAHSTVVCASYVSRVINPRRCATSLEIRVRPARSVADEAGPSQSCS